MAKVVAGIVGLAVVVGLLLWSQRREQPFCISGLIEADQVRVGSRVGGRVSRVWVEEGERVPAGSRLVSLEPFDLQERLAGAEAELAARRAELRLMEAGYRIEEIEQARARRDRLTAALAKAVAGPRPLEIRILEDRLAVVRADLVKAESDLARVQQLRKTGSATQQELDDVVRALEAARARVAQATDELELMREGTRAETIAEARAAVGEAEQALAMMEAGYREEQIAQAAARVEAAAATVASTRRRLEELEILAPSDCIVEAIDLRVGDLVSANAPVVSLLLPSTLRVRAYLPENRLDVAVGREVSLRVDAFPSRRFAGHVTFVASEAEFTPSNVQTPEERSKQVFRVRIAIDEGNEVLRAGMAVDVFLEPAE